MASWSGLLSKPNEQSLNHEIWWSLGYVVAVQNLASAYSSRSVCKGLVGNPEDEFVVGSIVDFGFDVFLQLICASSRIGDNSLEMTSAMDFGSCPSSGS